MFSRRAVNIESHLRCYIDEIGGFHRLDAVIRTMVVVLARGFPVPKRRVHHYVTG